MKRACALVVAVLSISTVFAQRNAPSAPSVADLGEKYVSLIEQMANIVDKDKANCSTMGNDLEAWVSRNNAEIERMSKIGQQLTPEQRAEFKKKYGPRIAAAEVKMRPGMMNCSQNAKVKDAFSKMRTSHP